MGKHRGRAAATRRTRPVAAEQPSAELPSAELPSAERPSAERPARHPAGAPAPPPAHTSRRASRRAPAARRSRVAALPWLTVVLLLLVGTVGLSVLRPDTYAATATVTASDDRAASAGAVALTRRDLAPRVRQELEVEGDVRAPFRLSVDHPVGEPVLLVTARAEDPRLAALAADTAAALVVTERRDELTLSTPAPVPVSPERTPSPWWAVAGLTALTLALLVERAHGRWELRHTPVRGAAGGTA